VDLALRAYKDWDNYYEYPLGPTYVSEDWTSAEIKLNPISLSNEWTAVGALSWADINYIGFMSESLGEEGGSAPRAAIYVDNFRITGTVIRGAYNSKSIAKYGCKQKVIKNNVDVTDSLSIDDDSSMLAQRLLAELLRSQVCLKHGTIVIPGDPDFMAGQLIHIHAARTDDLVTYTSGFKIDQDFRISQCVHSYSNAGFTTQLTLISDLQNSVAIGPVDSYSSLIRAVNPDAQNKTLQSLMATREFDIRMPILARDYPS
jgi:hypothetical protein